MNARTGIALGVVALLVGVLSPLSLFFAVAIVPVVALAARGLDDSERRWVIGIVAAAVVLRVAAIAGLFLAADHARVPFAALFGDEEYFIKRSLWLRNVALGVPLHPFDLEYAFEPNGTSSFLYALGAIQAVVGPAPYGLRLLSVLLYVAAVLLLYRAVRPAFGRVASTIGLAILLFLPSLFAWSIAVLKEPPFVLLCAVALTLAAAAARATTWRARLLAASTVAAIAFALQTLRTDGGGFVVAATLLGLSLGFLASRPRLLVAVLVAAPILAAVVLRVPEVQLRAYAALQRAARQHWGAVVVSPGVGYKLLDDRFYSDVNVVSDLHGGEAARYVVRGAAAYALLPLPWQAQSRTAAAYIPEQVFWYVLLAFVAAGIAAAFRRDPYLSALLVAFAGLLAAGAALTDGNVGTLVRHRSLALPYLVWFGATGVCEVLIGAHRRWL